MTCPHWWGSMGCQPCDCRGPYSVKHAWDRAVLRPLVWGAEVLSYSFSAHLSLHAELPDFVEPLSSWKCPKLPVLPALLVLPTAAGHQYSSGLGCGRVFCWCFALWP